METSCTRLVGVRGSFICRNHGYVEKVAYLIFEGVKLNFVQITDPSDDGSCRRKFRLLQFLSICIIEGTTNI